MLHRICGGGAGVRSACPPVECALLASEGLPCEDVVRECETFGIELPKAWAETKKEIGQKRREAEKAGDIVGH